MAVPTPIYPPFLDAPANNARGLETVPLLAERRGAELFYSIDFARLERTCAQRHFFIIFNFLSCIRVKGTQQNAMVVRSKLKHPKTYMVKFKYIRFKMKL